MVFSSFIFIFGFLPTCLLGFWLLSRTNHRYPKIWLCAASLVFYGYWNVAWIPLLLTSVAVNYIVGWLILRRVQEGRRVDIILMPGIAGNLLALVYYKYLPSVLAALHVGHPLPAAIGLPLGISFFTFTQIAFLVDTTQGLKERYTPLNYLLFVTFFPHLIAGPIVHHRDLMPQFEEPRNYRFQPREVTIGLVIFAIGLAEKTMIADRVAPLANAILGHGHQSVPVAWIGAFAYSMQLYFDFSGYSDMAIGLARLFGIKFPINFDSPYKATSIIEFWQRWHITLTRFLTAYVYNPIALALVRRRARGGLSTSARASKQPTGFVELIAFPTILTMLLAGIWHGAGLQFIVFGLLHGFYITINHAWRIYSPKMRQPDTRWLQLARQFCSGALVYLCVLVAQIFFRANSVGEALGLLGDMLGLHGSAPSVASGLVTLAGVVSLVSSMIIAWLAPSTQQIMANFDPALSLGRKFEGSSIRVRFTVRWAAAFALILFVGLINIGEGQPFIYFQF